MFGANLVILAQTSDELSCGQGKVYGRTDAGNDNTPLALKAKGLKRYSFIYWHKMAHIHQTAF